MLILAIILSILMALVLYFDIRSYIIPNWLVLLTLALYPALLWLSPVAIDWKMSLLAMAITFFFGFLLFSSKIMGGGDVKLIAACCLWTGIQQLPEYLIYTSALGGLLSLALLLGRPTATYYAARLCPDKPLPKVLTHGEPVPYGVAIAIAFLILLWMQKIPGIRF